MARKVILKDVAVTGILHPVSLTWRQGERLALMGANGSGKSTLAKVLAGQLQATSGSIQLSDSSAGMPLCWQVAYIGQHPQRQIVGATVGEELAFALVNRGYPPDVVQEKVAAALEELGLTGKANQSPHALSGGERQRLVIAAVLHAGYSFIIFDESLSMLDWHAQGLVRRYIARHVQGAGVLWITHDPELAAQQDRLLLIKDGKVEDAGSPLPALTSAQLCREYGIQPLSLNWHKTYSYPRSAGTPSTGAPDQGNFHTNNLCPENQRDAMPVVLWKEATFPPHIRLNAVAREREFIAVLGSSGSGKSTLLESVVGIRRPLSGCVEVKAGGRAGVMLQEGGEYLLGRTVYQEIFPEADEQERRRRDYLRKFGLERCACSTPEALSGGQRQIAALAAALAHNPTLLLLDEPLLGLDYLRRNQVAGILQELKEVSGTTVLYATHDLGEVLPLADRLWLMRDGHIVLDCPVSLWENYKQEFIDACVKIPGASLLPVEHISPPIEDDMPQAHAAAVLTGTQVSAEVSPRSPLAELDPRLKLVALMLASLGIATAQPFGLAAATLFAGYLIYNTPHPVVSWRSLMGGAGVLGLFYAFFLGWDGYSGLKIWEGHWNLGGLTEAAVMTWKIFLLFTLTLAFISTTSFGEQGLAVNWLLSPLYRLKSRGDLALLVMLTLRFIPLFRDELRHLWKARLAKGPLQPGLIGRAHDALKLVPPLLRLALRRAEEVNTSLLGRGYDPGNYRSHHGLRWKERDRRALVIFGIGLLFIVVGSRVFNG